MIEIVNKERCCGCGGCKNVCPKHCIKMILDEEGFRYPYVNIEHCINCGQCEKVCPMLSSNVERDKFSVKKAYAAINRNSHYLKKSSSGGVFIELAKFIIESYNGVVVGVVIDKEGVVFHKIVDNLIECDGLLGSKYVQSDTLSIYKHTKEILDNNYYVLFSGTPCQIASLKKYLRKEYDKLITIDFACHGVPSPGVWNKYIKSLIAKEIKSSDIKDINFRNKYYGWKNYSLSYVVCKGKSYRAILRRHGKEPYLQAFISGLILRPSCFKCDFKHGKNCCSDITLCDYWRVRRDYPSLYNRNGVSGVILNTQKGEIVWKEVEACFDTQSILIHDLYRSNESLYKAVDANTFRMSFFSEYTRNEDIISLLVKYNKIQNRCYSNLVNYCKSVLGDFIYWFKMYICK